jgi:hypothetical protein
MKVKSTQVLTVLLVALMSIGLAIPASGSEPEPCIELVKTGPETAKPGETITYHFTVTNCGDPPFDWEGFWLRDDMIGDLGNGPPLATGESYETSVLYQVPWDQCGPMVNTAKATGQPWGVEDTDSWTVDVICEPEPCKTDLLAGKHWIAGYVQVTDIDGILYVQFVEGNGWALDEMHLYVDDVPPKKSAPGRFNYNGQYSIPLTDFDEGPLYIAAHAVVSRCSQEETAWADTYGVPIRPGKNWAMYFGYDPSTHKCFRPGSLPPD